MQYSAARRSVVELVMKKAACGHSWDIVGRGERTSTSRRRAKYIGVRKDWSAWEERDGPAYWFLFYLGVNVLLSIARESETRGSTKHSLPLAHAAANIRMTTLDSYVGRCERPDSRMHRVRC